MKSLQNTLAKYALGQAMLLFWLLVVDGYFFSAVLSHLEILNVTKSTCCWSKSNLPGIFPDFGVLRENQLVPQLE